MSRDVMPSAGSRAAMLIAQHGDLFVYGTLQFPEVLRVLLGRTPDSSPVALKGWRAAALVRRTYPGLVPGNATVPGMLLTGLRAEELEVLDEYESGPIRLAQAFADQWPARVVLRVDRRHLRPGIRLVGGRVRYRAPARLRGAGSRLAGGSRGSQLRRDAPHSGHTTPSYAR